MTEPIAEETKAYNEDVEVVVERIHEYLDHFLVGDVDDIDESLEDCAAAIVDQVYLRWFGELHYSLDRIKTVAADKETPAADGSFS